MKVCARLDRCKKIDVRTKLNMEDLNSRIEDYRENAQNLQTECLNGVYIKGKKYEPNGKRCLGRNEWGKNAKIL